MECCEPSLVRKVTNDMLFEAAVRASAEDLLAFAKKDPAAKGSLRAIAQGYSSFKAVAHYRLTNALCKGRCGLNSSVDDGAIMASIDLLSYRGKMLSGAEIHPQSVIGRRFVLDHGWGTVIGETSSIGDDCYVLGGVTLGAVGIAGNPHGKRHPTLGDRVQIGAFARLFGPISVGEDVFIGPHCVVRQDIQPRSRVVLKTALQVVTYPSDTAKSDRLYLKELEIRE
ncbi:serine acetyltransferase [Dyella flava]|uniref:Serine acetyltransferase n=2 Tax=Dyella flava TaxID=1920170 RepID=A0ABS2K3N5_9GAMM|nr:serine acetyltransferase [Dyella flava]